MTSSDIRVLFVGEGWLGSCARSLKEALSRNPLVDLDEIQEDSFFPSHRARWLRAVHRLLRKSYQREFYRRILSRVELFAPRFLVVYKGHPLDAQLIRKVKGAGVITVNVYPDYSPHAYGLAHQKAVGEYDLVITTKPFHCISWKAVYGYSNQCFFVSQGYDPTLHLNPSPPLDQRYDVVLVATWRQEYGVLMKRLAALLEGYALKVAIGGNGWTDRRGEYPSHWVFAGELHGRCYTRWLRSGRICIAPVMRNVSINGAEQPGDEDSTRTYELAAAHCFFIHRRTEFVRSLYDEATEVPMYETAEELGNKILYFLDRPEERSVMAAKAHSRAVTAYSIDRRADEIVSILQQRHKGCTINSSHCQEIG